MAKKDPLWKLAREALCELSIRHEFTMMDFYGEVQIIETAIERLRELEEQCQTS